jgi:hypothetical protein
MTSFVTGRLYGLIKEASSTTNVKDNNLIYDRERFRKNKAQSRYDFYYQDHKVIVEQAVVVLDFDARIARVQAMLDA